MDNRIKIGKLYKRIIKSTVEVWDGNSSSSSVLPYITTLGYNNIVFVIEKTDHPEEYIVLTEDGLLGNTILIPKYWELTDDLL